MGWRLTVVGFVLTVIAAAILGIAGDSPDATNVAAWRDEDGPPPFSRCEDVPPVPSDVAPGWGGDASSGAVLGLFWAEGSGAEEKFFEYLVRVDDPSCKERPDIWKYIEVDTTAPRFEDARVVVRPGEDRAYVGYTLIDNVGQLFAPLDKITATRADGRSIEWKHQTATGGPAEIKANGTEVVEPATDEGPYTDVGDADYFNADALKFGETITVTFRFFHTQDFAGGSATPPPRAVVKVPFHVVTADGSR
jgi:hypothetical protein